MQAPLPENPYTADGMTMLEPEPRPRLNEDVTLDTPNHVPTLNHFQSSNMRQSVDDDDAQQVSPTTVSVANAANILANAAPPGGRWGDLISYATFANPFDDPNYYDYTGDDVPLNGTFEDDVPTNEQFLETESRTHTQAYAKISLPDGDYYVSTLAVKVVRDQDFYKQYEADKRQRQRERAQESVVQYRMQPSQQSQHGSGEQADPSSSQSALEGRPARALPSNYSEQGGAVAYASGTEDDEREGEQDTGRRRRRRRRRMLTSKSSDSTSVAPASLHPNMLDQQVEVADAEDDIPVLPIHPGPGNEGRICNISREHLLFQYHCDDEVWELHVLGNIVLVNGELYRRGTVLPLAHGDSIVVASVEMFFKLPDVDRNSPGLSRGTFAESEEVDDEEEEEEDLATSPAARRLSNVMDESDEEENEVAESNARPKPKLKGPKKEKLNKIPLKKKPKEKSSKDKESPETGKKGANKKPATNDAAEIQDKKNSPPTIPTQLQPGSVLEGLAPDELPQRRKGPGRPPKNGHISKRDENAIKRKIKEYEKRGEKPPPANELIDLVRQENKAKDLAAKATAKGEAPPAGSATQAGQGEVVMQSIEGESGTTAPMNGQGEGKRNSADGLPSNTPAEPMHQGSPKPFTQSSSAQRVHVAKSHSPIAPESTFTEEQLKKPNMTYVHILDEVLRHHPIGKADLQELYDCIIKRYPFYKYRVTSTGWQSSVRHNLLQHPHFRENGRSGKGRLWAINPNAPLDREKKVRVPRPTMGPQQMHGGVNGAAPMYGQGQPQQYGAIYGGGQPGYGAGQQYYSPYSGQGVNGAHAGQMRPPNNMPPGQYPRPPHMNQQNGGGGAYQPTPQPPQQQQPQPPAPQPSGGAAQFHTIVSEILAFRIEYLNRFAQDPTETERQSNIFGRVTNVLSAKYHEGRDLSWEGVEQDEGERTCYELVEAIMRRHRDAAAPAARASDSSAVVGGPSAPGSSAGTGGDGAGASTAQPNAPGSEQSGGGPAEPVTAGPEPARSDEPQTGTKRAAEDATADDDNEEGDAKRTRHK